LILELRRDKIILIYKIISSLIRIGRKEVGTMTKKRMALGSWDFLWQAATFIFMCIFLYSVLVGLFVYLVSCFYLDIPAFVLWSGMDNMQQAIIITIAISVVSSSFFLTIMLTVLYEKIIYNPVKDLLHEVERASGFEGLSGHAENYLRGGKNKLLDLYSPRESWTDRVHDYIEDVTQERYFDEITGCFNRKYFSQSLTEILNTQMLCLLSAIKSPPNIMSYSYCLYLLDIDHFKQINDEFGHAYGDQVLSQVGRTLRATVGSDGVVVRNGGEEFLIIAYVSFPMNFSTLAEKIRSEFCETVYVTNQRTQEIRPVTCSIGFVPFPLYKENITALSVQQHVNLTDQAMYLAKSAGRNTWRGVIPLTAPDTQSEFEQAAASIEYGMKNGYYGIEKSDEEKFG